MIKKLIILALAVGVLIVLITKKEKSVEKSRIGHRTLDTGLRTSITGIQVKHKEDSTFIMRKDGKWITEDKDFPADTAKVNKVLDIMFKLEDEEIVSRNPERVSEYGLDTATRKRVSLVNKDGSKVFTALLGKTSSADYTSTYWKKFDSDIVYRTPGNFVYDIDAKAFDWKDKKLYSFDKDDIASLEVHWKDSNGVGTNFSIKPKGDGNWEMTAPKSGNAKKDLADDMGNRFKDLAIDEFPSESDSAETSKPPTIEISAMLVDGKSHRLVGQKGEYHTFIKHPARDEIVKVANWRLDVFEKTVADLYEEPPPPDSSAADTASKQKASVKGAPAVSRP